MKEITQFENYRLEIWRRPRQRHMHLTVRPDGSLRVTCNQRISKRAILAFVAESRAFITKRALELEVARRRFPSLKFMNDETILWRGQRMPISLVWSFKDSIQVRELDVSLEIMAPIKSSIEERALAMQKFFQKNARRELPERLEFWARKMGLTPEKVCIRGQSTRWGSCSGRGEIALNWKLLCAPHEVIDYVIVHELAHLKHMNHSPRFWALVADFMPTYRDLKLWLRVHENEINWIWRPEMAPAM